MKILILGGTGLVGKALMKHFQAEHEVAVFGREIYQHQAQLKSSIERADILIQLSGATIAKRWNDKYKQEIWDSRIKTNQQLLEIFSQLKNKPKVLFASAVGYYPASNCQQPLDEDSNCGTDELSLLAVEWEKLAKQLQKEVLIFRFGVVLSPNGGALKEMLPIYKLGLGGPISTGTQCFPWVSIEDLVRAFDFAIDNNLSGTFNLTAPELITQKQFGKTFAQVLKRPFLVKTFEWQLKLIFGQGAMVLTKSISVTSEKLQQQGFVFDYPTIRTALKNLL